MQMRSCCALPTVLSVSFLLQCSNAMSPFYYPLPEEPLTSPKCTSVCRAIWQFRGGKKKPNQEQLLTCTLHVSSLGCALPPVHGGLLKAGLVEKCFSVLSFGRTGCRATRFSHHLTLGVRHSESNKEG